MQIQISWLLQKPTDLDLHCLQGQNISGFSRTRVYSNEPEREKMYLLICSFNEDSNQPAHSCSPIRDFIFHIKKFCIFGLGGRVVRRCRVSYVTWGVQLILAYSSARPAVLAAGKRRGGNVFISSVSLLSFLFFFPCPTLSSTLLSLLSLFSLSLGDDTKRPTRVDVSLNPNTINQSIYVWLSKMCPVKIVIRMRGCAG